MGDLKFEITNSDNKVIAHAARKVARQFDPWGSIRPNLVAFILGAACMAAMDFGDIWVCAGDCKGMVAAATGTPQ